MVITDDKASLELAHFIQKIHLEEKTLIHGSRSTNSHAPWDDLSMSNTNRMARYYLTLMLGARCRGPGRRVRVRNGVSGDPGPQRCDGRQEGSAS